MIADAQGHNNILKEEYLLSTGKNVSGNVGFRKIGDSLESQATARKALVLGESESESESESGAVPPQSPPTMDDILLLDI